MKIEYDGIYAHILKDCPLPCNRCAFNKIVICTRPNSNYILCGSHGFEKDPGYIFKI